MTTLSDIQEMRFRFNDTDSIHLQKLEKLRLATLETLGAINEAIWGMISGTLSDQTDLQAAFDLKLNAAAVSAFGLTLIDDANAAAARTTIGLGSVDNTADSAKNVLTATKLVTARNITMSGDVAWTVSFDGSAAVSAAGTLATVNSNTGTYGGATTSPQISVDGKGRITGVSAITITPAFSSLTSVPTTLAGHNITLTSGNVTTALGFTPLNAASNLSDLANAGTARTNLGLGTAAVKNTGTSGDAVPVLNGGATTWANPITVDSATDAKLVMTGSANPQLVFKNASAVTTGLIVGASGALVLNCAAGVVRLQSAGATICDVGSTGISPLSTTTASAANLFQSASGTVLLRSTSSLRYKTAVRPMTDAEADKILALNPIAYRSTAKADDGRHLHFGLAAEEVAEIIPQMAHFAYQEDQYEEYEISPAIPPTADDEGIPALNGMRPRKGEEKRPDAVQYERFVVALLSIAKRQRAEIGTLTARVASLEAVTPQLHAKAK